MGGGCHCTLVSRVHGKQVSPIIPILIRGETEAQRSPPRLALGNVVWERESVGCSAPSDSAIPPGSCACGVILGQNTGVGCHALLLGIFPIQGWNPGLLRWQADSLLLSRQGGPSVGRHS